MALYTPSYGGVPLFGTAVKIKHTVNPTAQQLNAFFGVSGQQAIFGGSRGRVFMVRGVWTANDPSVLRSTHEALLLSYADGVARTLVDTFGVAWSPVIYRGDYSHDELSFAGNGYALPFRAVFHGLV